MIRAMRWVLSLSLVQLAIEIGALLAATTAAGYLGRLLPAWPDRRLNLVAWAVTFATAVAVLLLAVRFLERRPWADAGFARLRAGRDLLLGLGGGIVAVGVVIGVFAIAGWYRIVAVDTSLRALALLSGWLCMLLLAAALEEIFIRGVLFRLLERAVGSWVAVGLSGALFGGLHGANPAASVWSSVAIALSAGVAISALYMVTRSLWAPIGLHGGWNFGQGPLFGTPVSGHSLPSVASSSVVGPDIWTGGRFGPEASIVTVALWLMLGAWLLVLARRRGAVVTPAWLARLRAGRQASPGPAASAAPPAGDTR